MSEEIPWINWEGVRVPRGASKLKKNLRIYETGKLMDHRGPTTAAIQFRIDSVIKKINIANKKKKIYSKRCFCIYKNIVWWRY